MITFQLHGVDELGHVVARRTSFISRYINPHFLDFFIKKCLAFFPQGVRYILIFSFSHFFKSD